MIRFRRRPRPALWGHRRGDYTPQPTRRHLTIGAVVAGAAAFKVATEFERSMALIQEALEAPVGELAAAFREAFS